MTATVSRPGRTKDPKLGTVTIVDAQPDLTVPYLILRYGHTSGQTDILTEDGQPLAGMLVGPSAQLGDTLGIGRSGRRGGNVLHDLSGARIEAAIEQHGARAIIIHPSAVEAATTRLVGPGDVQLAKMEYERAAVTTPGGLLAMPGFDEWLAQWQRKQAAGEEPLEQLRADLETKLAKPNDVAVLIVAPTDVVAARDTEIVEGTMRGTTRGENPYFTTGIDPNATDLLTARAKTSPVGVRGDKTPVGRIDDPVAQLADPANWGVPEPPEPAPTRDIHAPPSPPHAWAPQKASTYVEPDAAPPAPETDAPVWEPGTITELTPQAAHALGVQSQLLGTAPRYAQLYSMAGTLVFSWAGQTEHLRAGSSGSALGDYTAHEWALRMVENAVDRPGAQPQVVLADVRDLDVDLEALAQIIPVTTLPGGES